MILLGMIGGWQIAVIVIVFILLFGAKRIPEMFRGFGEGIKEFKKAANEVSKSDNNDNKKENSDDKE